MVGKHDPDQSGSDAAPSALRTAAWLVALVLLAVSVTALWSSGRAGGGGPTPRWNDGGVRLPTLRIDVNAADETTLAALPGIGPTLASRIVEERQRHGPYADPEALARVRGIGPRTVERLRPFVEFGRTGSGGTAERARNAKQTDLRGGER